LQVNVSAAVEIVSQLELWEKFEGERKISITEMVELTKADEIIISKYPLSSPSSVY
jgi:hypothetical protein